MLTSLFRIPRAIPPLSRGAVATLLAATALLLGFAGASWRYSLPRPEISAPAIHAYAGARPIAVIHPRRRAQTWVPLERVPRPVVDAVLTAEDRRFRTHPGIDVLAIGRALHADLKTGELREGASTIMSVFRR